MNIGDHDVTETRPRPASSAPAIARCIERVLVEYGGAFAPDLASVEGELADKIGGCVIVLQQLEADASALTSVIERLTAKRRTKLAAIKHLTTQVQAELSRECCRSVDTAFGSAHVQTCSEV